MLAVDGEQEPLPTTPGRQRELSGSDEALLVRERERHTALERPERRADPGEADHRVQHDVRLRAVEDLGRLAADLNVLDTVRRGKLVERPRAGRERTDDKVGVGGDHLERLAADRSGRADDRDSSLLHRRRLTADVFSHGYAFPKARIVKNAAGPAHRSESRRSRMPP